MGYSFYCKDCREQVLLRPEPGESSEEYLRRANDTKSTTCPYCGREIKECEGRDA